MSSTLERADSREYGPGRILGRGAVPSRTGLRQTLPFDSTTHGRIVLPSSSCPDLTQGLPPSVRADLFPVIGIESGWPSRTPPMIDLVPGALEKK
jgi:hypothetical protein